MEQPGKSNQTKETPFSFFLFWDFQFVTRNAEGEALRNIHAISMALGAEERVHNQENGIYHAHLTSRL